MVKSRKKLDFWFWVKVLVVGFMLIFLFYPFCTLITRSFFSKNAAGFTLEDALPLEQVLQAEDPASLLLGVDAYFAGRPVLILKPAAEKKVRNGMTLVLPDAPPAGEYRVYSEAGEFLALSRVSQGKLITIKSFFQV